MATYAELLEVLGSQFPGSAELKNKIRVAIVKRAQELLDGEDHSSVNPSAAEVAYAVAALVNPATKAEEIFPYVVMANSASTQQQIVDALDTVIQTNVDNAIQVFIDNNLT